MSGFEIMSEVTTEGTEWNGERHSAWSGWDKNTAPTGYVINDKPYHPTDNPKGIKVEWLSQNGSENTFQMIFEDQVEIVHGTGLKFPRTIKVQVFARSPKHQTGARGWSKLKVTGTYIKIP